MSFAYDKYSALTIVLDTGAIAEFIIDTPQVDALGVRLEEGKALVTLPTYELNSDNYSVNEGVVFSTQFVMNKIFSITSKPAPHTV